MARNKIIYGNETLIDLTGDTAQESDVAQGKTFHKADGSQATGTATGGGTAITPSNSSPVALTEGDSYVIEDNDGYAIQSYISKTPSSSPPSVSSGDIVQMGGSGYLINSYSNITPTQDGTYFSSGFKKMSSSGYAYDRSIQLPPDFFETWYVQGSAQIYTFPTRLKYVYVCCLRNGSSTQAVITTSGTYSVVHTDTYQIMYLINNIAPNDTIKVPVFSVSGGYRSILFLIGRKA